MRANSTPQLVSTFGMATETKAPELVATALDALHKLLAYRWINGAFHDEGIRVVVCCGVCCADSALLPPDDPEHRKLIDKVIAIIGKCYENSSDQVREALCVSM